MRDQVFKGTPPTYATGWVVSYIEVKSPKRLKAASVVNGAVTQSGPVHAMILLYDYLTGGPVASKYGIVLAKGYIRGEDTLQWSGDIMVENATIFGRAYNIDSGGVDLYVVLEGP